MHRVVTTFIDLNTEMEKEPPDEIHTNYNHCISFLQANNAAEHSKLTEVVAAICQNSSPLDDLLHSFTTLIQKPDEIAGILIFLRTCEVLDVSDCQKISNKAVHHTTDAEVIALVDAVSTRGPHGLWYILHAVQPKHEEFFAQMHGDIKCCVCDEVEQIQIEGTHTEESFLPISKQPEILHDLLRKVDLLKTSFSRLENRITTMIDKMSPLEHIRNELKDVMSDPQSNGEEFFGHTNITVFNRVKLKYFKLLDRLHPSEPGEMQLPNSDNKTLALKEIVCNNPDRSEKGEEPKDITLHAYNDLFTHFEDRFFEVLAYCNPLPVVQRSVERMTSYVKNNKTTFICLIGATICIEVVGSYVIEYGVSMVQGSSPGSPGNM